jgi:conjugative transposon TraJ protein
MKSIRKSMWGMYWKLHDKRKRLAASLKGYLDGLPPETRRRYIQVYLWLPVSDMFSTILAKIQVLMLQNDIERMQADPNFSLDSSDGVYIVFLCIGIIGYFTIPTVAGWIIQAGGMGGYGRNVNQMAGRAGSMAGSVAGAAAGNAVGRVGKLLK